MRIFPFKTLQSKAAALTGIAAMLSAAVVGVMAYWIGALSYQEDLRHMLLAAVEKSTTAVSNWHRSVEMIVENIGSSSVVSENLEQLDRTDPDSDEYFISIFHLDKHLSGVIETQPSLWDLSIHDPKDGRVLVSVCRDGREVAETKQREEAAKRGRGGRWVSDVFAGETPLPNEEGHLEMGLPTMLFSIPIWAQGRLIGVLVARPNLWDLQEIVGEYQSNYVRYSTQDYYVMDGEGRVLTETRFEKELKAQRRIQRRTALELSCVNPLTSEPTEAYREGAKLLKAGSEAMQSQLEGYADYRGVEVIGAWSVAPETQWITVAEVDYADAYAALTNLARVSALLCVVVGAVVAGLASVFARRMARPLEVVTSTAQQLAQGRRDARCRINRSDEVGELARCFDHMADQVQRAFEEMETQVRNRERAEEKFRKVVEFSPNGIVVIGQDRVIMMVNAETERLFGYSRDELIGRPVETLIPERFASRHPEYVQGFFTNPSARRMGAGRDLAGLRKDGSEFPIEIGLSPVEMPEGLCVMAAVADITTRKMAEQKLRQVYDELERRVEQRTAELSEANARLRGEIADRMRAEKAVEASETKFRALFEFSRDAVTLFDQDHFIDGNEAVLKLFGCSSIEQFRGMHPADFSPPRQPNGQESRVLAEEVITKAYREGWAFFEWVHRRLDGTEFPAEVMVSKIRLGDKVLLQAVTRDITQRKQAQEALRESEERFRGTFERTPVGVAEVTLEGRWQRVNPKLCEILGYSAEELKAKTFKDITHPEDLEVSELYNQKILTGQIRAFSLEKRYIRKNGSIVWVELSVSGVHDASDRPKYFIAVIGDITERKHTQEALRESEDRFRAAFERAPIGIAEVGLDGRWLRMNPKLCETLGYSAEELKAMRFQDVTHPDDLAEDLDNVQQVLSGKIQSYSLEKRYMRKDGSIVWANLSVSLIRDASGQPKYFVSIVEDITPRKKAEEELREAKEEAENASRAMSVFLTTMSHELRTPLNGVIGMIELLRDSGLNKKQLHFAEACHSSAVLLLNLINDVLDFSKIEAGKIELDIHEFDLMIAVAETADLMAVRAHQKGLELVSLIAPEAWRKVRGDGHRLRQVLINLIGNAIKFTAKGEIVVRVAFEAVEQHRVFLRFSVTDSGIGIPQDRVGRLFQSFSQVDSSTTRKFGGTGLGLAICKNLIELMGGRIGVNTQEGKGSEFWFTLSFELVEQGHSLPLAPNELKKLSVLVVDRSQNICDSVGQMMTSWGITCKATTDVDEAQEVLYDAAATGRPFDLVLVDRQIYQGDDWDSQHAQRLSQIIDSHAMHVFCLGSQVEDGQQPPPGGSQKEMILRKPVNPSYLFNMMVDVFCNPPGAARAGDRGPLPAGRAEPDQSAAGHISILLVEDNPTNQLYVHEVLKKVGYTCTVANNGCEAIEAVKKQAFDVVLMDCQMPEMDGFDASMTIRRLEKDGQLPGRACIVALTANALKGDREKCLAAGMDDYLSKPIDPKQLLEKIQSMTRSKPVTTQPDPAPKAGQKPTVAPEPKVTEDRSRPRPINTEAALARCMGDANLLARALELFASSTPSQLNQLKQSVTERDSKKAALLAHSIKGSAGMITAELIQSIAAEIEALAKSGQLENIEQLVDQLSAELDRCVEFIPSFRS